MWGAYLCQVPPNIGALGAVLVCVVYWNSSEQDALLLREATVGGQADCRVLDRAPHPPVWEREVPIAYHRKVVDARGV